LEGVVARFGASDGTVAANHGVGAKLAGIRAIEARVGAQTVRRTAIIVVPVAVVAHLGAANRTVTANDRRFAGAALLGASVVRLHAARSRATVAGQGVAVVALLGVLVDLAVPAARSGIERFAVALAGRLVGDAIVDFYVDFFVAAFARLAARA
jgi:hypothetical protein